MALLNESRIFEYDLGKNHIESLKLLLEEIYLLFPYWVGKVDSDYWTHEAKIYKESIVFRCRIQYNKIKSYEIVTLKNNQTTKKVF